jgi:hypothetical protein
MSALLRRLAGLGEHGYALAEATAPRSGSESATAAVAALADLLPEGLFRRAIDFVRGVVDRGEKNFSPNIPARSLAKLLRHAPRELLQVGEEVTKSLSVDANEVIAAIFLRRVQLDGWEATRPAWESDSESMRNPRQRGYILSLLLPSLPADIRPREAERALELSGFPWGEEEATCNLLDALPPRICFDVYRKLLDQYRYPVPLTYLSIVADRFPQDLVNEALSLVKSSNKRAQAPVFKLLGLVLLKQRRLDEAVEIVQFQGGSYETGRALLDFLPFIARTDPSRAVSIATNFEQHDRDVSISAALRAVAPNVRPEFLPALENRAAALAAEDHRSVLLAVAEGYARAGYAQPALKLARFIGDDDARIAYKQNLSLCWASVNGAAHPGRGLDEALAISAPYARLDALKTLAGELPVKLAIRACDAVLAEPDGEDCKRDWHRTEALRALLRRLCDLGSCSDAWSLLQREPMDDAGLALRAMVAAHSADPDGEERLLDLVKQNPPTEAYRRHERLVALVPELRGRALWWVVQQLYSDMQTELVEQKIPGVAFSSLNWSELKPIEATTLRLAEIGEVDRALTLALSSRDELHLGQSLLALAPYLNKRQAARAFSAAKRFGGLARNAVGPLLASIAKLGAPRTALRRAVNWQEPEQALKAFAEILPHLSLELVHEAISAAATLKKKGTERTYETESAYEKVFIAATRRLAELGEPDEAINDIVAHLPDYETGEALQVLAPSPDLSPKTLEKALELARKSWRPGIAYQGLLPFMVRRGRDEIRRAFRLAAEVRNDADRRAVLHVLPPAARSIPVSELYQAWSEAMQILAHRSRSDFLRDLGALLPLVARLGGHEALEGASKALEEVRNLWP